MSKHQDDSDVASSESTPTVSTVPPETIVGVRRGLLEHLQLLASPEAQRAYERDVPIAFVPAELFCGWFDDLYGPDDAAVQAAFLASDLDAIAEFHELFLRLLPSFPDSLPSLTELQRMPAWAEVVAGAATALAKLDPTPAR